MPGTVVGSQLVYAPNLGWHDVDLSGLWPHYHPELPLIAGNDATCAAVAESRHGAGVGAGTMLYLHLAAGIGGAVVESDRVVAGATGTAGEFGHMPFGDPAVRCRCGALGCWNTTLDGGAVARMLGQPVPADEVSYLRRVLAAARAKETEPAEAVRALARSVGRGAAGLVNALDPHLVAVGGLGRELLEVAGGHATAAYHGRADGVPDAAPSPAGGGQPAGRRLVAGRGRAVLRPDHHRRGPAGLGAGRLSGMTGPDFKAELQLYLQRGVSPCCGSWTGCRSTTFAAR